MLRKALLGLGVLLMFGGLVLMLAVRGSAGVGITAIGTVLLLALLMERRRYKCILDAPPGPDWRPTGERFIEPGSDDKVEVYYHPPTGRRSYVRTSPH